MKIADHESPQFLHIYKNIGTLICHNTQHHTRFQKLFPSSGEFKQMHLKKETVHKTHCDVICVVTNRKNVISMCGRTDIKASSKMYWIKLRSCSLCSCLHTPVTSSLLGLSTFLSILFSNTIMLQCCTV
jgi:hypothetical protein